MPQKDFYKVLGVDRKAPAEEIKKAYKKLAVELHPDKYPSDTEAERKAKAAAESRFKEITEAYATLGDEKKRHAYDVAAESPYQGGNPGGYKSWNGYGKPAGGYSDFSVNFWQATSGKSPAEKLHFAVRHDMADMTNYLLENGVVPAQKTLEFVVQQGMSGYVEALVSGGARPTSNMLHYAVKNDMVNTTNALLQCRVVPAPETLDYVLAREEMAGYVEALVDAGAKATSDMLHDALERNMAKTANALLNAGVRPAEKTLQYAVEKKQTNNLIVFINRGGHPTSDMLCIAISNDDLDTVNVLLSAKVKPDQNALWAAVKQGGGSNCVELFIKKGAKPTPEMLDYAFRKDMPKTVKDLLAGGVVPAQETLDYVTGKGWSTWVEELTAAREKSQSPMAKLSKKIFKHKKKQHAP